MAKTPSCDGDNWHSHGALLEVHPRRAQYDSSLHIDPKASDVISNSEWHWPHARIDDSVTNTQAALRGVMVADSATEERGLIVLPLRHFGYGSSTAWDKEGLGG